MKTHPFPQAIPGFKPDPNLQKFVTIRGLIKTCRWLGYPIFETIEMLNESLLAEDKIYVNYNAEPGFNRNTSLANKPIVEFLAGAYQISFDTKKGIFKFPINDKINGKGNTNKV